MTEKFGHVVVSKKTGIPTDNFIISIFSFGNAPHLGDVSGTDCQILVMLNTKDYCDATFLL